MADRQKQVFLTDSPTRWQRFKWTFRIIIFISLLLIATLGVAIWKLYTPKVPHLKNDNGQYVAILDKGKSAAISAIDKKYEGFARYIAGKGAQLKHIQYVSKADSLHTYAAPVRAAFYDPSDEQA